MIRMEHREPGLWVSVVYSPRLGEESSQSKAKAKAELQRTITEMRKHNASN